MGTAVPSGDERAQALRVKLTWITVFRTVTSVVLLGVLGVRLGVQNRPEGLSLADTASFAVIGVVFVTTLANGLLLRTGRVGLPAAWAQVVADVLFASAFVLLTGGSDSPFVFVYSIAIIAASVLLGRAGSLVGATLSSASYLGVSAWMLATHQSAVSYSGRFLLEAGTQVAAQFIIAALSGFVADQLTRTGGELTARQMDLEKLQSLQREIFTSMPSGLITCDDSGQITSMNPAAIAILGQATDQRGQPVERVIPGSLAARPGRRVETVVNAPAGVRTLGMMVSPLVGQPGSLIVFQDLTELRRMQVELKRIDHLADLGRTVAQLAHEVKNPLASVRGSAQMLAADLQPGVPHERLAQLIVRESDRLVALVDGYLRLARPPPPAKAPVALHQLVSETVEMLRNDPDIAKMTVEESLEPVEANVDSAQVKQVLINLLRNACAAAGPTGRVRVSARAARQGARLEVWDSAGSIPPEDLERIFEPFYSTREGGTGLGLSTTKSIIDAHGGAIELTSAPGTGTTFAVTFAAREGAS